MAACPGCGHDNAPGSRFCNQCGAALAAAPPAAGRTPPHLAARILSARDALEGERKHVTVLLADLKGSMELLADRDPEEARALLDPVLQHMMDAVHHFEGTVNQVMGDGIMALFGAPLAHEDHALRACYAALRMQREIGRYGDDVQRSHGVPVQIRVGLNSGEVVVRSIGSDLHMDYTAVGQTTHLAARMEQMAKPGSVLLGPPTLRLVEGHVQVRSLGPVPVKGMAEPVEVFELLGAGVRTRLQAAADRGLTRFVGRDPELATLRAALEEAGAGRGQVVALVGDPGVGKSRLIWELVRSHRTRDWLVLETAAVSYGHATPLLPVAGLLRAYLGIEDRDDVRRAREKLTGRVLTLDDRLRSALPALGAVLDLTPDEGWRALGADRQRAEVLDAVTRLLLRESEVQPLVLVVEDLHWIDADTQGVLDALIERVPGHRILLLVNHRSEYRHGWGGPWFHQLRLAPLAPETAEALLAALLGSDPGLAALTGHLIERTGGNPFFLEETVRSLAEAGVLIGERGAYRLARTAAVVQVPATVQAILAARIDRLAPADRGLLQAAAVIGQDVPLPVLEAVVDGPPDEIGAGLGRLGAAEFLHPTRLFPEAEYAFAHALTHEVTYASVLHDRRRALHRRAVTAIERLYPEALGEHRDRLLRHAFRGELWSTALRYLQRPDDPVSEAEIDDVMGIGPESAGRLWWTGEHERARRAAERDLAVAASFRNFPMRVGATCRLAQAHHAQGDYARAAELLRQIVAALPDALARERFDMAAFPSVFARSYLAWCLAELGEVDAAGAAGQEAVAIADAADHAYSRGHIAYGLGTAYVIAGRSERAIPLLERALVVVRMVPIPFLVPFLVGPLGAAYTLAGEPGRGRPLLEQAVEQGVAVKLRAHHALRVTWLGEAHLALGRPDAAREQAVHAVRVAEECGERGQAARALCLLAEVTEAEGADAGPAFDRARAAAEALGMAPLAARCARRSG